MKRRGHQRIEMPAMRLHPIDLNIIENVLATYLGCVLCSNQQGTSIGVMQRLQRRLSQLLSSSPRVDGVCILYTDQEFRAMSEALSGYMELLRQFIPPSSQHEEVLEELQDLDRQIAAMLSPNRAMR